MTAVEAEVLNGVILVDDGQGFTGIKEDRMVGGGVDGWF